MANGEQSESGKRPRWTCPICTEGNPGWASECCECGARPHPMYFSFLERVNADEERARRQTVGFLQILDWLKAEIEVRSCRVGQPMTPDVEGARNAFQMVLGRLTGDLSLIDELESHLDEALAKTPGEFRQSGKADLDYESARRGFPIEDRPVTTLSRNNQLSGSGSQQERPERGWHHDHLPGLWLHVCPACHTVFGWGDDEMGSYPSTPPRCEDCGCGTVIVRDAATSWNRAPEQPGGGAQQVRKIDNGETLRRKANEERARREAAEGLAARRSFG